RHGSFGTHQSKRWASSSVPPLEGAPGPGRGRKRSFPNPFVGPGPVASLRAKVGGPRGEHANPARRPRSRKWFVRRTRPLQPGTGPADAGPTVSPRVSFVLAAALVGLALTAGCNRPDAPRMHELAPAPGKPTGAVTIRSERLGSVPAG